MKALFNRLHILKVTVPVRGVRCIKIADALGVSVHGYCPREGSEMHPGGDGGQHGFAVVTVPVRGVRCIGKNAQRHSDAFVESFQILLLG